MTSSIRKCVTECGGESTDSVVAVVGADHFEGVKKCYKDVFGASEMEAKIPELLECKDVSSVDNPGLRLAIALQNARFAMFARFNRRYHAFVREGRRGIETMQKRKNTN